MSNQYKELAHWSTSGKRMVYHTPCILDGKVSFMVHHLGFVKKRADNRWNWWRKKANGWLDFPGGWTDEYAQGVSSTQEDAQAEVEKGWELSKDTSCYEHEQ